MYRSPILYICISFILGILLQEHGKCGQIWIFSILFCGFLLSFLNIKILKFFGLLLFFFGIGSFFHLLNQNFPPKIHFEKNENITFTIDKKLNSNDKNRRYEISILNKNQPVKAVFSLPKHFPELDFKHYYNADAYVNRIEKPQFDFQFDYQKYMERKGIFYQIYSQNPPNETEKKSFSLNEKIKQYRLSILQKIDDSEHISTKSKALLKGIILADRTEMDAEILEDFTQTGLVHILAISGAHIAIIFMAVSFIFGRFLPNRWAILVSLGFIWFFVAFIGFGNSVVRAAIMLSIYHIYKFLQRNPNVFHTLILSAFIILIFNTNELFDVGFQLSFSAVLGIFWFNKPILSLFPNKKSYIYNYLLPILSLSISAQLGTLPLILYYFHQFPLLSIITNLVIIPIAEVIIIISFGIVLFFSIGFHSAFLEKLYSFVSDLFLDFVHFFSNFNNFLLKNIPINLWETILLAFIIYHFRFLLSQRNLKNAIKFSFSVFLFLGVRTFFDVKSYSKDEFLIQKHYKSKVFIIKNKNKILFCVPENADMQKMNKFIFSPYFHHSRTSDFEIKYYPKNAETLAFKGKIYSLK